MIYIINKEQFHQRPPVISTTLLLSDMGHDITLICSGINGYWKEALKERGINVIVIPDSKYRSNKIGKVIEYCTYSKKVREVLEECGVRKDIDLVWMIGGNTITAMCRGVTDFRYVMQIQEMHETDPLYLKAFGKIINKAELVFLNEYNRCAIFQVWYRLAKTPYTLPNKPYFLPKVEQLDALKRKYSKQLQIFKEKKVILYQGIIHSERDITTFVKTISRMGDKYQLVLLGKDRGIVSHYKEINPHIIHIESLPAPDYLVFTSMAHIGLVTYDPLQLNTTYCAPNKIYEYSAYGKPIIGNNIPGLQPINNFNAGCLVNENNEDEIRSAILKIDANYNNYSNGANNLFAQTDNKDTISKALLEIGYKPR